MFNKAIVSNSFGQRTAALFFLFFPFIAARIYGGALFREAPRSHFMHHTHILIRIFLAGPYFFFFFFGEGGGLFLQKKWDILFLVLFTVYCFRKVKSKTVKR